MVGVPLDFSSLNERCRYVRLRGCPPEHDTMRTREAQTCSCESTSKSPKPEQGEIGARAKKSVLRLLSRTTNLPEAQKRLVYVAAEVNMAAVCVAYSHIPRYMLYGPRYQDPLVEREGAPRALSSTVSSLNQGIWSSGSLTFHSCCSLTFPDTASLSTNGHFQQPYLFQHIPHIKFHTILL